MANQTCSQILKLCHLRLLRLAPAGLVAVSADARYEFGRPVLLGYTEVRPDPEHIEQVDGCGDVCGVYDGPQKAVSSVTMKLQLCEENAETEEMLLGGSLITEGTGAGDTIGYLAATDATANVDGVAIEGWSYQWAGKQRATKGGQPAWYRHVFPKTFWTKDEVTLGNQFTAPSYTGTGLVNAAFGTGYTDDPIPVAVGDSPYAWFIDDEKPTAVCGYQAVA